MFSDELRATLMEEIIRIIKENQSDKNGLSALAQFAVAHDIVMNVLPVHLVPKS
jgi:hypothetical protein